MIKNYVNALKIFKTNCQPSIYTNNLTIESITRYNDVIHTFN